jgi:hypothetical protein
VKTGQIGVNPPVAKLPEGRLGALVVAGRVGGPGVGPDGADAGLLLGQVGQVEVDTEGTDQGPQVGQAEFAEPVAEPPGRLGRGVGAEVLGRGADLLDQRVGVLPRQPADRLAQQPAEQVDVATESFQRLGPHARLTPIVNSLGGLPRHRRLVILSTWSAD